MLYHLFDILKDCDIPGQGLFNYLTFRAIAANVVSMFTALFAGRRIIGSLRRHQIGETIRDLGLEGQMSKKGTPTMGGIIIIVSLLAGVLLFCDLTNIYVRLLLLTTVWCGALGFADDYIKVFRHNKDGLSERGKLIAQMMLGVIIALVMCFSPEISSDTTTTIPFIKDHEFDYAWLAPWGGWGRWTVYAVVIVFIITACSNGANLTDGMDGLSTGVSAISVVVLGIMAWLSGNVINSAFLDIMFIPGSGEIAIFLSAFVGALTGFLWYNTYPAQVFMGDTGSLCIGGIIGVSAVLIRKELLLPVLCGIFVAESLSVILQRGWFRHTKKKTGTGKRLFRMAPLHHHYQKQGIPEPRIVVRFWLVGLLLAAGTLALLKIR